MLAGDENYAAGALVVGCCVVFALFRVVVAFTSSWTQPQSTWRWSLTWRTWRSRGSALAFLNAWLAGYAPQAETIELVRLADTGEYNLGQIRDGNGAEVGPWDWFEPYVRDVGDVVDVVDTERTSAGVSPVPRRGRKHLTGVFARRRRVQTGNSVTPCVFPWSFHASDRAPHQPQRPIRRVWCKSFVLSAREESRTTMTPMSSHSFPY